MKPHLSIGNSELAAANQRMRIHLEGPIFSPLDSSSKKTQCMRELSPESTLSDHSPHKQGR